MFQICRIKTSSILSIAKALKTFFFFLHNTHLDLHPGMVLRYQRREAGKDKERGRKDNLKDQREMGHFEDQKVPELY